MASTNASPMTARILTALTLPKSRRAVVDNLRGDGATQRRLRVIAWWCASIAYTCAISVEVVFSGKHYVVDVLGAAGLAGAVALASRINMRSVIARFSSSVPRRSVGETGRLKPALESVRAAPGRERGQALIEMALVLPLIMVFILALVDFGIAIDRREVLQHAVYEGSRRAAVGTTVDVIKDRTVAQSQNLLTDADITVCYIDSDSNGDINAGDDVRVSADYIYRFSAGGGGMLKAFGVPDDLLSIGLTPEAESRLANGPVGSEPLC